MMIKKIIQWFKDRKQKKEREKRYKEKIERLKKQDPFTYKH
jgi:hypothetical protein